MNILSGTNPAVSEHGLSKIVELWNHQPEVLLHNCTQLHTASHTSTHRKEERGEMNYAHNCTQEHTLEHKYIQLHTSVTYTPLHTHTDRMGVFTMLSKGLGLQGT